MLWTLTSQTVFSNPKLLQFSSSKSAGPLRVKYFTKLHKPHQDAEETWKTCLSEAKKTKSVKAHLPVFDIFYIKRCLHRLGGPVWQNRSKFQDIAFQLPNQLCKGGLCNLLRQSLSLFFVGSSLLGLCGIQLVPSGNKSKESAKTQKQQRIQLGMGKYDRLANLGASVNLIVTWTIMVIIWICRKRNPKGTPHAWKLQLLSNLLAEHSWLPLSIFHCPNPQAGKCCEVWQAHQDNQR